MANSSRTRTQGTSSVAKTSVISGRRRNGDTGLDLWYNISANRTYYTPLMTDVFNDVVTPDFKRKSAMGVIINNDMWRNTLEEYPPQPEAYSRHYIKRGTNGGDYGTEWDGQLALSELELGGYLGSFTDNDVFETIAALKADAITRAHANASSAEIAIPMVLAEGDKTVASLVSLTKRAWRIVRAVKKLDLKYLRKQITLKELQDRYMECRYAIRPLVIDTHGLISAVEESKQFKSMRRTSRAFAKHTFSKNDTVTVNSFSFASGTATCTRTTDLTYEIRAGVLSDVVTSGYSIFGADQILQTAWEIIPFSFIVDWFVNVGDTIAAWTPNAGVQERASWVVVKSTETQTSRMDSFTVAPLAGYHTNTCSVSGNMKRIVTKTVRTRNPQLSFHPRFNVKLDALKLLDLGIIGRNLLR